MSGQPWRCFVAVALDASLRTSLADAIATWRTDPHTEGLRWAEPEGLHVTLAFLGSVDPERLEDIGRAVGGVARRHAPVDLATGRLGAFARSGSARVLWYAVADPDGALATLADDLADALDLPSDEPYRPHVTLARSRRRSVDLRGWIEPASETAPAGTLAVRELHLMRSHLGSGPARYETLATFPLGGPPDDR